MGYQFFLPMVLRWRASRAEAPLQNVSSQLVDGILILNFVSPQLIFRELKTYLAVQMSPKKLHVADTEVSTLQMTRG